MKEKIVLVTGATSGIGKATALGLARTGAQVVLVGRDKSKCQRVKDEIQHKTGSSRIDCALADLSSIEETKTLAQTLQEKYARLHVLVNNVGSTFLRRGETEDGFERTFALNHLVGYFLLTHLLLDTLKESAPVRIINVASDSHYDAKIHFDDLQLRKRYGPLKAYSQSKLANVLFTYELARRLKDSGVTVNAMHPGFVNTNMARTNNRLNFLLRFLIKLVFTLGRDPSKGAETILYLATSPEVKGVTGKYWMDQQPKRSSSLSYDEDLQKRLWEVSENLLGIETERN